MPQIFDNIDNHLLDGLTNASDLSHRADFCVGYFNLRGWRKIDSFVGAWQGGDAHCCRLLVGMQAMPYDQLRSALSLVDDEQVVDQATALAIKCRLAQECRYQLMFNAPTDADEQGLRRLAKQLDSRTLVVKLFLRHPLHAKLYLLFRQDPLNPTIGYLGSSNLTLAGYRSRANSTSTSWTATPGSLADVDAPNGSERPCLNPLCCMNLKDLH